MRGEKILSNAAGLAASLLEDEDERLATVPPAAQHFLWAVS